MTVTHSPGLVRAYSGAKLYIGSTTCAFRVSAMQIDETSSEYELAARCDAPRVLVSPTFCSIPTHHGAIVYPTIIAGGCFCGAIRYRAISKPSSSMLCHCHSCRRVAGSPVVGWVTFAKAAFAFTCGTASTFKSSAAVCRAFCPNCGSPLTYESTAHAGELDVTTCSLDHPDAFPPTYHAWVSDDVSWIRFGDDLEVFREFKV